MPMTFPASGLACEPVATAGTAAGLDAADPGTADPAAADPAAAGPAGADPDVGLPAGPGLGCGEMLAAAPPQADASTPTAAVASARPRRARGPRFSPL